MRSESAEFAINYFLQNMSSLGKDHQIYLYGELIKKHKRNIAKIPNKKNLFKQVFY